MADLPTLRAKVEAAQALAAKATQGPWRKVPMDCGDYFGEQITADCGEVTGELLGVSVENLRLFVAAPDLVTLATDLLDEVDRARLSASCAGFDLIAIGAACDIRDNEYPIQAVQRVVAELTAIRAALGNGADEAAWRPGETLAEAVGRLRENAAADHSRTAALIEMVGDYMGVQVERTDRFIDEGSTGLANRADGAACALKGVLMSVIDSHNFHGFVPARWVAWGEAGFPWTWPPLPAGHEGPHAEALGDNGGPNG